VNISPLLVLDPNDFKVGCEFIDEEHEDIIVGINLLYATRFNRTLPGIKEIMTDLVNKTVMHFKSEEDKMSEVGYPLLDAHRLEHESILKKADNFIKRFEDGEDIAESLQDFLFEWLRGHDRHSDRKIVDYINSHRRN
jgi:hemerythrin-like metal-binding protein